MDRAAFRRHYDAYRKGHINRRTFLAVTGLGTASAVIAACAPSVASPAAPSAAPTSAPTAAPSTGASPAPSADPAADWTPPTGVDLGDTLNLTTWPNYHDEAVLNRFTELTGVRINMEVYGSNEEMLAKLQAGGTGWDVLVPTNYTFETYGSLNLLEPLDLAKLPHYDGSRAFDARFLEPAQYPAGSGNLLGVPKDWGTTGYVVHTGTVTSQPTSWKEFFDLTRGEHSGRVTIHDYQLTSIGNALKYFGYSFNSVDPDELADAEELLIATKPHLLAITSDYQPVMRNGDAVMAMAWTGDAAQLNRDIPEIQYVLGSEGGEIWSDFFAVVTGAPHREAAYAFLDYMSTPKIQAQDAQFHGYPVIDTAAIDLLPEAFRTNPIIYPDDTSLAPLEFGAAVTLTDENRAELWARVKSS